MNVLIRVRIMGIVCALTLATGAAAGPLIKLGSEQQAAAAIVSVSYVEHETPLMLAVINRAALEYTDLVLRALATTTPDALARKNIGMTFPCSDGGSFAVRNTLAEPRVIDVEFGGCLPYHNFSSVASGPLRFTVLANSFTDGRLAGIRLGTRDRDFVIVIEFLTPDQNTYSTITHNLTMQGYLAMPRNQQADGVAATSLYEISGFVNQQDRFDVAGRAPYERTVRNSAEHLFVSTAYAYQNDFLLQDDDTAFLWGSLVLADDEPNGNFNKRFDLAGLRVHRVTDYEAWTDSLTLDGAVRYSWPTQAGSGCLSGGYLFDTRTPLHRPNLNGQILDAGELSINRDVNVRAYAPGAVPPHLPAPTLGMLLNVNVRGVGSFNYDVDAFAGPVIWAVAQCPY